MYQKTPKGLLKHLDFLLLDMTSLQAAFLLAYMVRHGFGNPYLLPVYRSVAIFVEMLAILVALFSDTYSKVLRRGYYLEFLQTCRQVGLVTLLTTFFIYTVQAGEKFSRTTMYLMGAFYLAISYIVRIMWKKHLKKTGKTDGERVLFVVTVEKEAKNIITNIRENNFGRFQIGGLAVMDRDMTGEEILGVKVRANRQTLIDYVCREWIDEVFISLPPGEPYPEDIIENMQLMGATVHMNLCKTEVAAGRKQFVEKLGDFNVLTTSINTVQPMEMLAKRGMDIVGGLVGCLCTGILFLVLAPVIYVKSPGPVIFSQIRVGKNGKKFKLYKFRSMYMDAEERKKELMEQNRVKDGRMFKLDYDPRIIGCKKLEDGTVKKGIGNYIRDWSLDEFPQFYNVLKGDMSLVGTRPPTVDEWERYDLHHRARLATKPGITGMWQVSGRSNIVDFEDVVKLDTKYITEWSMALDLRILAKTLKVVVKEEGAM